MAIFTEPVMQEIVFKDEILHHVIPEKKIMNQPFFFSSFQLLVIDWMSHSFRFVSGNLVLIYVIDTMVAILSSLALLWHGHNFKGQTTCITSDCINVTKLVLKEQSDRNKWRKQEENGVFCQVFLIQVIQILIQVLINYFRNQRHQVINPWNKPARCFFFSPSWSYMYSRKLWPIMIN